MLKKFRSRKWYPYAVALCIAVVLYVVLMHLPAIGGVLTAAFFRKDLTGMICQPKLRQTE